MTNAKDMEWFQTLLNNRLESAFNTTWSEAMGDGDRLFFGDYMSSQDPRPYAHVEDHDKLIDAMVEQLSDYNEEAKSPMNLVLFLDAIEHVSRIARVLRQPLGKLPLPRCRRFWAPESYPPRKPYHAVSCKAS